MIYKSSEEFYKNIKPNATQGETFFKITEAVQQGQFRNAQVITEVYDEFFESSNREDVRTVLSYVKQIILHLFKLAYGRFPESHIHLNKEIANFRNNVIEITDWDEEKREEVIIRLVQESINKAYRRSINQFKTTIEDNPDDYSITSTRNFQKECPWTLEELMDDTIDALIASLNG